MTNSHQGDETTSSDNQEMEHVRQLILGKDGSQVKQALRDNAREVVGEVFSEALHDREKQDGSVNKVLLPIVEKSVEKSVENHSEQFVGYLYPLVGSLVRKSVTAFLTDILEKTNVLIKNSLTLKGLKWRFQAWQAGISFSHYVASQTFSFRVEQVFLIHRETGLLLKAISSGIDTGADADVISSMLTAINDFVSDSFKPNADNSEQQLDVVKTDDFTLLVKQGPKAIVVAAVTGNMPQNVANQLQMTLEEIHTLYGQELSEFDGDVSVFENSENQLRDCLISKLKPEAQKGKKTPWLAWLVVAALLTGFTYIIVKRWQTNTLIEQIKMLDLEPGILIHDIQTIGLDKIEVALMRDPSAIPINTWLSNNNIPQPNLSMIERAYLSLELEIIKRKVSEVLSRFPNISATWNKNIPSFSGSLSGVNKLLMQSELSSIHGLNFKATWLDKIFINSTGDRTADDPAIIRAVLDLNIAKIDSVSVAFNKEESALSDTANEKLMKIAEQFKNLIKLADQQKLSLGLVIMGATDTAGTKSYNKILSQKRADNVKLKLQELGIEENRLNAIGLGVIDLKTSEEGARKVLFNVVYFDSNE